MTATAISVEQGAPKPPDLEKGCEELKQRNEDARKKVIKKLERKKNPTEAEKDTLHKAKNGGMTFSSAQISVNAGGGQVASGTVTASSSAKANECIPGGISTGGDSAQKTGLSSKVRKSSAKKHDDKKRAAGTLCDKSYVHPGGGAGAHAEAKIFNELTNKTKGALRGGSVLLNIDWRYDYDGKTRRSGMPCRHCFAMLCHAATECKIAIFLCDKDGKPTPLDEEDCKKPDPKDPDNDPFLDRLDPRIDHHPLKGRRPF
jgi:hypothetical protein